MSAINDLVKSPTFR